MNFYEFGYEELKKRGMFDEQAHEVMERVVLNSHSNENSVHWDMRDRWSDNINNYPPMLQPIVFMGIEPIALEYIKEKCPNAWFRPMFDKEHPLRKKFEEEQLNKKVKE